MTGDLQAAPRRRPRRLKFRRAFWRAEGGATAVEYGLLVAGIALALITAVAAVGTNIGGTLNRVSATLSSH